MIQKCVSKEYIDCIHLTKGSRDEVLKILEPRLGEDDYISIIEDNDKEVVVYHFGWHRAHYYYNHWYVKNYDGQYERYTEQEFKEQFWLVEE